MRTALLSTLILLSTWLAAPAAHADRDWDNRDDYRDYHEQRYDGFHEIQRIRAKLHRDQEARQRSVISLPSRAPRGGLGHDAVRTGPDGSAGSENRAPRARVAAGDGAGTLGPARTPRRMARAFDYDYNRY